ncbi:hypothetical protein [Nocardioides sp.]|uniref:hypothetical protein n=1 Tax=Nocardioides sp. TaxID=35761 RepID=UPI003567680A
MTPSILPQLVALHMGALHPVEQLLVLLLAFGPFVVLGVLIAVRRGQDAADELPEERPDGDVDQGPAEGQLDR